MCDFEPNYDISNPGNCNACGIIWFKYIYIQTYTRISPYAFGMLAAFLHREAKKESTRTQLQYFYSPFFYFLSILSIATVIAITLMGVTNYSNAMTMSVKMNFIWVCISRQLFGAAISFQMFLMTLPCIE